MISLRLAGAAEVRLRRRGDLGNHRGAGGSDRPSDPGRVGIDAFLEDAIAVMDHAGAHACAVAGWSSGVNTAFELAVLHPSRVTGLFAIAGVLGGTFAFMGAPVMIPRIARRPTSDVGHPSDATAGRSRRSPPGSPWICCSPGC